MQVKRIHFPIIDSTNTWAKTHAAELNPSSFTIITADEQTAGRGRFKREWVSPNGCNLYVSYVFFLEQLDSNVGNIPQVLALAAYEVVQQWVPLVKLKWPNDLVIQDKKVAGILSEVTQVGSIWAVIIGIGLNINMPESLIKTIDRPATSLMIEYKSPIERQLVAEKAASSFSENASPLFKRGISSFFRVFLPGAWASTGRIN